MEISSNHYPELIQNIYDVIMSENKANLELLKIKFEQLNSNVK